MRSFLPGEHHEEERLSALLDDELDNEDALKVTRHLAQCESCMAELEELRSMRSALRHLPAVEPPPILFDGVATAAATYDLAARRSRRMVAAAVAGAGLLAAAAFVAGAEGGTVSPPVDLFVVDHVTRVGGGPMVTPVDLGRRGS
ncbi:MAG TPA: zf-HC2 domain-containing protein [Nitriliruptorales bacterium]